MSFRVIRVIRGLFWLLRKKYFREIAILNRFLGRLGPQILHEDFL